MTWQTRPYREIADLGPRSGRRKDRRVGLGSELRKFALRAKAEGPVLAREERRRPARGLRDRGEARVVEAPRD